MFSDAGHAAKAAAWGADAALSVAGLVLVQPVNSAALTNPTTPTCIFKLIVPPGNSKQFVHSFNTVIVPRAPTRNFVPSEAYIAAFAESCRSWSGAQRQISHLFARLCPKLSKKALHETGF
jgi:hypothetical protein